jgi:broad specificity phosphatase PhoE
MVFGAEYKGMPVDQFKHITFPSPLQFHNADAQKIVTVSTGNELRKFHKSTDTLYDCISHPGGESKEDVIKRFTSGVIDNIDLHSETKSFGIVTHGAALRCFVASFKRDVAEESLSHSKIIRLEFSPENRTFFYKESL